MLAGGSVETADMYYLAKKAKVMAVREAKNSGVGGVCGGHGEGLLAGLKEVLANHQTTLEAEAGLSLVFPDSRGLPANLDWRCSSVVEGAL